MVFSGACLVAYYSFSNRRWMGEAFGIPPSPSLLTNRSETIAIHSPRYSAASLLCWFEKAKAFELHAHVSPLRCSLPPCSPSISLSLSFPLSLSLSPSITHSLSPSLRSSASSGNAQNTSDDLNRAASTLHRMGERVCTDRGAAAWGNRGRHPGAGLQESVGFINGPNNVYKVSVKGSVNGSVNKSNLILFWTLFWTCLQNISPPLGCNFLTAQL